MEEKVYPEFEKGKFFLLDEVFIALDDYTFISVGELKKEHFLLASLKSQNEAFTNKVRDYESELWLLKSQNEALRKENDELKSNGVVKAMMDKIMTLQNDIKERERKAAKLMIEIARDIDFEQTFDGCVHFKHNIATCMKLWEEKNER